jgi:hypothetical protein
MASKILKKAGINANKTYKGYVCKNTPTKTPYEKGMSACMRNNNPKVKPYYTNPFAPDTPDYNDWNRGYNQAYKHQLSLQQLKYH